MAKKISKLQQSLMFKAPPKPVINPEICDYFTETHYASKPTLDHVMKWMYRIHPSQAKLADDCLTSEPTLSAKSNYDNPTTFNTREAHVILLSRDWHLDYLAEWSRFWKRYYNKTEVEKKAERFDRLIAAIPELGKMV